MNAHAHPHPAHLIPATEGRAGVKTRAEYLAQAEARQPREGINSKFCRASHAELARADMMIGYRLDKAAQARDRAAFQAKWAAIAAEEKAS